MISIIMYSSLFETLFDEGTLATNPSTSTVIIIHMSTKQHQEEEGESILEHLLIVPNSMGHQNHDR
jgi:hypothetical protein